MPFWWPFGRKRRKNRKNRKDAKRVATDPSVTSEKPLGKPDQNQHPASLPGTHRVSTYPSDTQYSSRTASHQASQLDFREKIPLSPRQTHSPSIKSPLREQSAEHLTALPPSTEIQRSPHLRPVQDPTPPQSPPSVRSKRSAYDQGPNRSKSNKKRKDEHQLDSHVKAMSSPIPIPKRSGGESKGLLRRDSKRLRDDLRDQSLISLPAAASVRSSISIMSDNHFEVGSVDIFSPRPTIRHSLQSQFVSGALRSAAQSRTDSRWERAPPSRSALKESRTIDRLADDFDAGTLKDLMERDERRRERKRKAEEDRARRRLERHAAKAEAAEQAGERPRSRKKQKERLDAQHDGLGLTGVAAGPSAPKEARRESEEKQAEREAVKTTEDLSQPDPVNDQESAQASPVDEAYVGTAKEIRYSQASMSPPTSPIQTHGRQRSSLSQAVEPGAATVATGTTPENDTDKRASVASARRGGALASLFRRSAPPKKGSREQVRPASEMSFSNTSRESMRMQAPSARPREAPPPVRVRSGAPSRTRSKFREDLPELPLSPPDSRMQSPETPEVPSIPLSARQKDKLPEETGLDTDVGEHRDSTGSFAPPSAAALSQSLASVDSEGSWLSSGKPRKRTSQQLTGTPGIMGDSPAQGVGHFRSSSLGTDRADSRLSSIRAPPSVQEYEGENPFEPEPRQSGDAELITRGDVARQPTVVHLHREGRTKSSEGLLKQFNEGEETEGEKTGSPTTPDQSPTGGESLDEAGASPPKPEQAQHARQMSGGSARLLNIPARAGSVRSSMASATMPSPTQ